MSQEKKLFYASIKERYQLNHPSSSKKTYHVVLDVKGSGIQYQVGDCVAIYPTNHSFLVEKILSLVKATGHEIVLDRDQNPLSFSQFLFSKANLCRVNRTLSAFCKDYPFPADLKTYLESYDVPSFLETHSISCTPQELVQALSPLTPRFYSIASSMSVVGEEVHLTVALTEFASRGHHQFGTCSYYLTQGAPLNQAIVPIYFQLERDFTLPKGIIEDKDIIMIGPGAGIAPFMGFIQERVHGNHSGRNWLFFGERERQYDYYYQNILDEHVRNKQLKLDLAFSRDQPHKVYVQHRMLEQAKELTAWLDNGAYLYVCGDATRMAKDVEKTLTSIIAAEKNISDEHAKEYIKAIRREKRYLRDVY